MKYKEINKNNSNQLRNNKWSSIDIHKKEIKKWIKNIKMEIMKIIKKSLYYSQIKV